jgi:hypothetical protein
LIPILKCGEVKIELNGRCERVVCSIGFIDEKLENGKFDCLLPRGIL